MRNPFRRKKQPSPPDAPQAHYTLAHIVLPAIFRMQPLTSLAALASPAAEDFLDFAIGEAAGDLDRPFAAKDFKVHTVRIEGRPVAVVEFPPPLKRTHAYFVAMVVELPEGGVPPKEESEVATRYFTLERTGEVPGMQTPDSVLGGWTENTHVNFGDGGPPTLENFRQRVAGLLAPSDGPAA